MSGTLRLRGSTSGYSELQAPAVAADQTFVLPTAGGTLLTTDSPVPKLTLELGSASQPSLTFQGDTDTGLFSEGTNTLNLVTGGSSKVVLGAAAHTIYAGTGATVRAIDIDSSGNIGVGTSSPQQVLHLASSAATTLLQFNDSGSGGTAAQVRIGSAGNDFVVLNNTASNTATERLRITSGGRVGIGTTSPDAAAKLVVSDGGEEGLEIRAGYNVGASEFIAYNRTSSTYIDLRYDAGHHAFKIAGSEKARIDSSGRLLVQSSSAPTQGLYSQYAPLTVQGYIGSTTGNGILNIARGTTASSLSNGSDIGTIVFSDSAGGEFSRISCFADAAPGSNDYPGRISFHTSADGSSNPTERMQIDSSGRVGIGGSPTYMLDVQGTDAALRLKGTSNTGFIADQASSGLVSLINYDSGADLRFGTASTERLRIDSVGDLIQAWRTAGFIGQKYDSNYYQGFTFLGGSSRELCIDNRSGDTRADIVFRNGLNANVTEKMRIDSSGRLLIGTTTEGYISADTLTIAESGNCGLTIRSGTSNLGTIAFSDATSGGGEYAGYIQYSHNFSNLGIGVDSSERININSSGFSRFKANGVSTLNYGHEFADSNINTITLTVNNQNASFNQNGGGLLFINCARSASSAYTFLGAYSSNVVDREFNLRGDGNAYADGSWNGGGADYAEYFEWSDGNLAAEDRRGISVVLDGDKIRKAVIGEEPIGVISGNPSVVGDAAWNKWTGKYLRDEFGTYIQEDYEVEDDDGNTVVQQRRKLNPDYDPDIEYIPREERPEWDCVGLMGKLRIRKGQPTGSRWIKMRDISDFVEEWLVR